MERLTYISPLGNPVSKGACAGVECLAGCDACDIYKIICRLAAYEDTGLEPEEVQGLKLYTMAAAVAEIQEFDGVPIARLKELAAADKEGRALIVPAEEQTDPYRQMLRDKIGPDALRLLDMLEGRG